MIERVAWVAWSSWLVADEMSINIGAKADRCVALFLLASSQEFELFRLQPWLPARAGSHNLEGVFMRPNTAIGILLIVLGVLALGYQGITYTRQERVLDIGPVHATAEKHERIPIPPLVGGLILAGGIGLLLLGGRRKT
jgi:hypothetical protein